MTNFNIKYQTNSYININEKTKFDVSYENSKLKITNLTPDIIKLEENNFVLGLCSGLGKISVCLEEDESINTFVYITVLPNNLSNDLMFIIKNHESNIFVRNNLGIGAGRVAYYKDIYGSVNKLLFNKELNIDYIFHKASNDRYKEALSSRVMESIEFITVHYTGNMRDGANAYANASWFAKPLDINPTSIHYCTGNDGIFKGLDEIYMGAHAGDYSSYQEVGKFLWYKTGIKRKPNDPKFPCFSIGENGNFYLNGLDTNIKIPFETKFNRGIVKENKWLNLMGPSFKIENDEYYIGTCWWCYSQIGEGRICSTGGNHRSIGIESCVNEGSDLWYTWQITAMLVADIMVRHNLDIYRVRGHHAFTAKNCPQPMLENDLEIWWKFIELVEAEYEKLVSYNNTNVLMVPLTDAINDHGRVITNESNSALMYKLIDKVTNEEVILVSSLNI